MRCGGISWKRPSGTARRRRCSRRSSSRLASAELLPGSNCRSQTNRVTPASTVSSSRCSRSRRSPGRHPLGDAAFDPVFRVDERVSAEALDRRRGRQDGPRAPAGFDEPPDQVLVRLRLRCFFVEPFDELTRRAAREGPEAVQAAQLRQMLVPSLGPHRVVAELLPVQVELAADEVHDRRRNELAPGPAGGPGSGGRTAAARSRACCGDAAGPRCSAGPRRSGCSGAAGPTRVAEGQTGPTSAGRSGRFSVPCSFTERMRNVDWDTAYDTWKGSPEAARDIVSQTFVCDTYTC